MTVSYYWVIYYPNDTASVSGPGAKPAAPSGGRVFGPYNTLAEAQNGVTLAVKGKGSTDTLGNAAAAAASVAPSSLLSGLNAIGDFFSRLTEATTWERIGEVVLGLVLIAVGVAHITHAVPVATKVAKTAGAVALAA